MKHFVLSFALPSQSWPLALLRKPRTIITGIITIGIMATLSPPTGITIALTGGAEVTARRQLVEPLVYSLVSGGKRERTALRRDVTFPEK